MDLFLLPQDQNTEMLWMFHRQRLRPLLSPLLDLLSRCSDMEGKTCSSFPWNTFQVHGYPYLWCTTRSSRILYYMFSGFRVATVILWARSLTNYYAGKCILCHGPQSYLVWCIKKKQKKQHKNVVKLSKDKYCSCTCNGDLMLCP